MINVPRDGVQRGTRVKRSNDNVRVINGFPLRLFAAFFRELLRYRGIGRLGPETARRRPSFPISSVQYIAYLSERPQSAQDVDDRPTSRNNVGRPVHGYREHRVASLRFPSDAPRLERRSQQHFSFETVARPCKTACRRQNETPLVQKKTRATVPPLSRIVHD